MTNSAPKPGPFSMLFHANGNKGPHPFNLADYLDDTGDAEAEALAADLTVDEDTVYHEPIPVAEDISDKLTGEEGKLFRIPGTNRATLFVKARQPGTFMLVFASVLLLALAIAQGYVSYRAQFTFIHSAGKGHVPATLEALGLDAAAAIFAFLALAKARRGKSSPFIERALNIACALGSGFMNVLGADLASPRSIAVYALPPVIYAATSDRLIAVVADAYGLASRSLWAVAGKAAGITALYILRLPLSPIETPKGMRRWVLNATPLPEAGPRVITATVTKVPGKRKAVTAKPDRPELEAPKGKRPSPKTDAFLKAVISEHGQLHLIEGSTHQIAVAMAGDYLHPYTASRVLREAVAAAKDDAGKGDAR